MNIVFSINDNYITQLLTAMVSILENNRKSEIKFYILSNGLSEESKGKISRLKKQFKNFSAIYAMPDVTLFDGLKNNIEYISIETYFRYVFADMFPDITKALYLDADLVVKGNLSELYDTELGNNYVAGVLDKCIMNGKYREKIGLTKNDIYINAGVLLMNLELMRRDKMPDKLFAAVKNNAGVIEFQDQDGINIAFHGKIKELPFKFNCTDRNFKALWRGVISNAVIIHFTGKDKPWQKRAGMFCFLKQPGYAIWRKYNRMCKKIQRRKIKVGLIIDEFFGGAGTAIGGYGALARKYVCRYIPSDDIKVDVLLRRSHGMLNLFGQKIRVDETDVYILPKKPFMTKLWLWMKNYETYLSIEITHDWVLTNDIRKNRRLIFWIQDPRPKSAWDNTIGAMNVIKERSFYNQDLYDLIKKWAKEDRIKFISQGNSLTPLALELYMLPSDTPVQYLPNAIDIDFDFKFDLSKKKKQVVTIGRLESQKRAWLFCEVAKRMPEYDFYLIGGFFRYREDNEKMLAPYMKGDIPNLHICGHLDGMEKMNLVKESRVFLNTAIWEGIPITWLEAMSYGTTIVAALEREGYAKRFGEFVGTVPGDGFDDVDKFIPAIKKLMEDDELCESKAIDAIEYVRKTHCIPRFIHDMRDVIYKESHL